MTLLHLFVFWGHSFSISLEEPDFFSFGVRVTSWPISVKGAQYFKSLNFSDYLGYFITRLRESLALRLSKRLLW